MHHYKSLFPLAYNNLVFNIGRMSLIMHHSQGRAPLRFKMNNEHGLGYWFGHQKCVVAACVYQPGTAMDCLLPN